MNKEISEKIKPLAMTVAGIEEQELIENATMVEDLGFDSLDILDLIMECEREFDIKVPDSKVEEIKTFGDFVKCIDEMIQS